MISEVAAGWYLLVCIVTAIGCIKLLRKYSSPPKPSISASKGLKAPHVTIIRACSGLDTHLFECLESTFQQSYTLSSLSIYLCVASYDDAAYPILKRLLIKYPQFDAHILVETDDLLLKDGDGIAIRGPNAKIRNQSRAYREAKGDIVWMIDCNVWVNKGTCGRMVDQLCGFAGKPPNKLLHQLPLVVDLSTRSNSKSKSSLWQQLGGRIEEVWFAAAHAKFYTAINTVLIAPCIVGKSNMFRKSHLNALTNGQGIDYFSHNICEDHLIGDLLWKQPVPQSVLSAAEILVPGASKLQWANHALDFGDLAIQPMENMSVAQFCSRRVRWLRARKFTVLIATLVEPGTESILCSLYGAYAITTLPFFTSAGIPQTWFIFWLFCISSLLLWSIVDYHLFRFFESGYSIERDHDTPVFARFGYRKAFSQWLLAWCTREILAFPIWAWASYGGVTIDWRGRTYRVGFDTKVRELTANSSSKSRIE